MYDKIAHLRSLLDNSSYTVALCGSGMLEESGLIAMKKQEREYEIEQAYGYSSEELFSSVVYNTRPELFFQFYRNEILQKEPQPTEAETALAAMEQAGRLQCIVAGNVYEQARQAGCRHVIKLHGSIYHNQCPRCKKKYSIDYIRNSRRVPLCPTCNIPIRPLVTLSGEQVDSQIMTATTREIAQAQVLLLLGTNLDSEVFLHYISYFGGEHLVIIHQRPHYLDQKAELVFIDQPKQILPQLGY